LDYDLFRIEENHLFLGIWKQRKHKHKYIVQISHNIRVCLIPNNNTQISLFPLGSCPWKITGRGLKWPLDNLPWKRGFCSLSNLTDSDVQELNPLEGRFLLITPET
jgi:thiamine pyrophosphokinase